jgi:peptidoglycan/LPS O-acetylase OafA/YrhL
MKDGNSSGAHETNLDFVRAIAVLIVVSAHLAWFFGNVHVGFLDLAMLGKLGVMIFFVHSGIVNMLSIERHVRKSGEKRLFWAFMARRCFRIYPLSILVVSFIFLTKLPIGHLEAFTSIPGRDANLALVPSLLLVQNFVRVDQILEPLWSLPYEVQIYCLFPVLFLALQRCKSPRLLIFAWALLALLDTVIAPHFLKYANLGSLVVIPDMLFYLLMFMAGLCAYKEMQASRRQVAFWALPALLATIGVVWCLSDGQTKCILGSFCFGSALPSIEGCPVAWLNHACAWVAKYSFGIYLLHDPAIWVAFVRFHHVPVAARVVIFLGITFGASVLVYHLVEHPMIRVGNRVAAAIGGTGTPAKPKVRAVLAGIAG